MSEKKDPGLGSKYDSEIKRLINEDGSYNIVRHGALRGIKDFYKLLIEISWTNFLVYSFLGYIAINLLFACVYLGVGLDQLSETNEHSNNFFNAFFFSVQTLTSVGYGQISPIGMGANIVATIESFIGLMSIALITGLLYGRFSKPTTKIKYSKNIIITPFKDGHAMMFKMVNQRNSALLNTKVSIILILDKGSGQAEYNKEFHRLNLQVDSINFFPLTWTIVHEIDEESPLRNLKIDEIKKRNAEVLVFVEAFDETHSQSIIENHSYSDNQWLEGVKFDKNFKTNQDGMIELHIEELDNLLPVED